MPAIPDGVYDMSYAFTNCTNITTVSNLPSKLTIMEGTFNNCINLVSIPQIPSGVIEMGNNGHSISEQYGTLYPGAFCNCTSLSGTINIPSSVTDMGYAFYNTGIEHVTGNLPNVESINSAFENCSKLKTVDIVLGDKLTAMNATFKDCSLLLKTPTIPNSVKQMDETFMNCSSLKEVTNISANWESLDRTFANCTSLTTPPTIPDVQIDNFENRDILTMKCTFDNCQGIYKKVKAPNSNRLLESYDSIILSDAGKMVAISVEGLYCGCTEVVDPSPDEGEDEEQDPTTPSNPGETSGNMSIYGTVQPITMIDVTVPLTIQFTIESDRTFTGPDSIEIKSNCPSPLDVNLYGVNKDDGAPSLVAPDTHSDNEWNNLSRSETLASIALMLDNTSLSSTGSTLGRIDSAFQSEKALDLDLSAKYGKAWDNSEDLVFTYNVVFEFAMP